MDKLPASGRIGARGFEPPTTSTPLRCATGLRYAPSFLDKRSIADRMSPRQDLFLLFLQHSVYNWDRRMIFSQEPQGVTPRGLENGYSNVSP